MIDPRLAEAALCHAVATVAFTLAAVVLRAALRGKPPLSFLWSLPSRLDLSGLAGRDWASVVVAMAAAGIVFMALSAPALVLLVWEIIR